MMKTCPDCLSEIPVEAQFCHSCGERVEGKQCGACGTRNWSEATICRWCGHRYESAPRGVAFDAFTVAARLLPTLIYRGRLLPQSISLTQEKIVIHTPGVFNLSQQQEEVPWRKIAGFDYRSGIFWDQVTVETRGQTKARMLGLAKSDGTRIRQILQDLQS